MLPLPRLDCASAVSNRLQESRLAQTAGDIVERSRADHERFGYDLIHIERRRTGVLINGYKQEDIERLSRGIQYKLTPRDTRTQSEIDRDLDLSHPAPTHTYRHKMPKTHGPARRAYREMARERALDGRDHSTWSAGKDELTKHYLRVAHADELTDLARHPSDPPIVVRAVTNEKMGDILRSAKKRSDRKRGVTLEREAASSVVTVYRPEGRVTAYPAPPPSYKGV